MAKKAMGSQDNIRILVIDDNELYCELLVNLIKKMGMTSMYETTLKGGLETAANDTFDVIFLDVNLPDGSGLDGIPVLREGAFPPEIIIITGVGDEDGAEIAIQNHAWDYITKDTSLQNMRLSLNRAIKYRQQKKTATSNIVLKRDGIIGKGPLISASLEQAAKAAITDSPVLILGETGTGKEVFAQAIHDNSPRAEGDFVVVDCSALPDHLVESTLFGHKKGAFTSADSDRIGLVEQAHGGTLFLDEIGELSENIQKKFLRILQEKRFLPVGGKKEVKSDFRLICATNRDLSGMVENGKFRRDLYYRICSIVIELPPLRNRTEDIAELAAHYINRHPGFADSDPYKLSPELLEALRAYSWPGNVRELFNTIDSICSENPQGLEIFSMHLPTHIRTEVTRKRIRASIDSTQTKQMLNVEDSGRKLIPLKKHLEQTRCDYIKRLMLIAGGDIAEACRISELSRGHLYDLLKKYQLRS